MAADYEAEPEIVKRVARALSLQEDPDALVPSFKEWRDPSGCRGMTVDYENLVPGWTHSIGSARRAIEAMGFTIV